MAADLHDPWAFKSAELPEALVDGALSLIGRRHLRSYNDPTDQTELDRLSGNAAVNGVVVTVEAA